MTIDEGYVKYQSFWTKAPVPHAAAAEQLATWRQPLFEAGLIGEYAEHGIGYGNISIRCGQPSGAGSFVSWIRPPPATCDR